MAIDKKTDTASGRKGVPPLLLDGESEEAPQQPRETGEPTPSRAGAANTSENQGADEEGDSSNHEETAHLLAPDASAENRQGRSSWRLLRRSPAKSTSASSATVGVPVEKLSGELRSALNVASESLLDLLFEHLSRGMKGSRGRSTSRAGTGEGTSNRGLSLPAAAVGWLSLQLFPTRECAQSAFLHSEQHSANTTHYRQEEQQQQHESTFLSPKMRDRLSLLRFLLPRATHIRLTTDVWPPPPTSRRKRRRQRRNLERLHRQQETRQQGNGDVSHHHGDDAPSQSNNTSATNFLRFHDILVRRPVIDMRVFPKCQVLLLDQVPVDWIRNLQAVQNTLQLLRVERSGIYDLGAFLMAPGRVPPEEESPELLGPLRGQDPLAPPPPIQETTTVHYPNLTHIKLSHCSITDSSGLRGPKQQDGAPSLAHLANVQSLSLSHNQLASETAALAGLVHMAFLTKLDLSFNQLTSLRRIHYRLGNIQTLQLSHNRLTSAQGIDRLFALETLWLDHNRINDMGQLSGLARLPLLSSLRLKGNPIAIRRTGTFRIELWDLFHEQRRSSLPPRASYRDLQLVLPRLDEHQATMAEMRELKKRAFLPWVLVDTTTINNNNNNSDRNIVDTIVVVPSSDHNNTAEAAATDNLPAIDVSTEAGILERRVAASTVVPTRPTGSIERSKRRAVLVDRPARRHVQLAPLLPAPKRDPNETPSAGAAASDTTGEEQPEHVGPKVDFSLTDVIRSLCDPSVLEEPTNATEEEEEEEEEVLSVVDDDGDDEQSNGAQKDDSAAQEEVARGENGDELEESEHQKTPSRNGENKLKLPPETNPDTASDFDSELKMVGSIEDQEPPEREVSDMTQSSTSENKESSELKDLKLSPIRSDGGTSDELKRSTETTVNTIETNAGIQTPENRARTKQPTTQVVGLPNPADIATPGRPRRNISDLSETPSSVSPARLPLTFPDIVPSDDHTSVQSSIATPSTKRKYQVAEENSTYDGPNVYKDIKIHEDLELYFKLFVFPVSQLEDDALSRSTRSAAAEDVDESEWRDVLKRYPRIQLWPVDVRIRDSSSGRDQPETFRRIWREKIVACGVSALRRLTPNRGARYGFHGELLWSDSSAKSLKPETIAECREVVVCCSSTCLYFILDYDKVTYKASDRQRSFPLPIPKDARFKDAVWPHALARHPFSSLRAITIGFMFQRLTLRFGKSSIPSEDDFTYIMLTSSKVQTISLLKEFQDVANEAKASTDPFVILSQGDLSIQNDDRHVLDSIGVAVAPDVLGATLHYQVLEQHWRRGERGNVRRVLVLTDTKLFLLDEDYVGDGAVSIEPSGMRQLSETVHRLVDSASLSQISRLQAADADPNAVTIVLSPQRSFQRPHNWRLKCRDRHGAERLVEDVRRAMAPPSPYPGTRF